MTTALHRWVTEWWRGGGGTAGRLLDGAMIPAELAFRAAVRARNAAFDHGWLPSSRVEIPVVSVGNLSVGGAGKTPFTAWLAQTLRAWGMHPAVVLRGYGGDEVLLHRELNPAVPVFANRDRAAAAAAAAAAGCYVVLLDDGFQHRSLARDLDVVLVAADGWPGLPRLLPRGPWRESLGALGRASAIVLTCKAATRDEVRQARAAIGRAAPPGALVAECRIGASAIRPFDAGRDAGAGLGVEWLRGRAVLVVAGLASPEPFRRTLRRLGAEVEMKVFPDHHHYTVAEVDALWRAANGRPVVTTGKDSVKLRPFVEHPHAWYVLDQQIELTEGRDPFLHLLRERVAGGGRE